MTVRVVYTGTTPLLKFTLEDENGKAIIITGLIITLMSKININDADGDSIINNLACTITDGAAGELTAQLTNTHVANPQELISQFRTDDGASIVDKADLFIISVRRAVREAV